jgi:lysyl-tRNA synthetase class 2
MELDEIIQQRAQKAQDMQAKGVSLYPSTVPAHTSISEALSGFQEGKSASLCGRVTARRSHGKATFLDIRDSTGKIQLYLKEGEISPEGTIVLEHLDIADIVFAKGELFKTRTGEPTIKTDEFMLLSKALRPLPEKWHGLKDVDLRYRQRYLDLVSNEDVKKIFYLRSKIVKSLRNYLDDKAFQEVETPMMHYIPGGAAGRPFKTHHNEYSMELFLRIAPELYLKRLLVGGMDRVYEINRSFRNEGVSTRHNPEFTMLEVYQAYANYEDMMRLCEGLIVRVAQEVFGKTAFTYQGKEINFVPPWQRVSFTGLVKVKFDIEPSDSEEAMLKKLQARGFAREVNKLSRTQIAKIIEEVLEKEIGLNPVFVTDYFTHLCPLAKTRIDNPLISERFELYVAGLEIGNAYSELNDPVEQRRRFEEEIRELTADEKKCVDDDYVVALEHGMPPAGGLGIGIDRLVMLLTDQPSIRDVILFPLLRPSSLAEE